MFRFYSTFESFAFSFQIIYTEDHKIHKESSINYISIFLIDADIFTRNYPVILWREALWIFVV